MKLLFCFAIIFATFSIEHSYSINGKWKNANSKDIFFRTLTFEDSLAVFTNLSDTIYRFKYSVNYKTKTLSLVDMNGKRIPSKIIKLDKDILVLDRIWHSNTSYKFYRQ